MRERSVTHLTQKLHIRYIGNRLGEPVERAVFASTAGYVQHVNVAVIHKWAAEREGRVVVAALPRAFAMPGRSLTFVQSGSREANSLDDDNVRQAFEIAGERRYDDDPRFGLVVLSGLPAGLCHRP